jgi:hypothetical protein
MNKIKMVRIGFQKTESSTIHEVLKYLMQSFGVRIELISTLFDYDSVLNMPEDILHFKISHIRYCITNLMKDSWGVNLF